MSMAALALAAASLGIWLYLIVGRGGFWLTRETDEALVPNIPHAEVRAEGEPRSTHRELEHPSRLAPLAPRIESGAGSQDEGGVSRQGTAP